MAVLDGQLAMDGRPLELELYANTLPGGFHWLVTSSSSRSSARMLKWGSGQWTDHATGLAVGPHDSYTQLERVTDLRSTLLSTSTPVSSPPAGPAVSDGHHHDWFTNPGDPPGDHIAGVRISLDQVSHGKVVFAVGASRDHRS